MQRTQCRQDNICCTHQVTRLTYTQVMNLHQVIPSNVILFENRIWLYLRAKKCSNLADFRLEVLVRIVNTKGDPSIRQWAVFE